MDFAGQFLEPTYFQPRFSERRFRKEFRQIADALCLSLPLLRANHHSGFMPIPSNGLRSIGHCPLDDFTEFCLRFRHGPGLRTHNESLRNLIMVIMVIIVISGNILQYSSMSEGNPNHRGHGETKTKPLDSAERSLSLARVCYRCSSGGALLRSLAAGRVR